MIIEVGTTHARVINGTVDEREWLREYLSFPDSKARFKQSGDGRHHMYNIVLDEFPAGLLALVRAAAPKQGFTVEVLDKVTVVPPDPEADLAWLREDQRKAIDTAELGVAELALGALHAIKDAGRRVPQDVAVVGVGDHEHADYFDPPLTCVGPVYDHVVEEIVGLLFNLMNRRRVNPVEVFVPPTVTLRAST